LFHGRNRPGPFKWGGPKLQNDVGRPMKRAINPRRKKNEQGASRIAPVEELRNRGYALEGKVRPEGRIEEDARLEPGRKGCSGKEERTFTTSPERPNGLSNQKGGTSCQRGKGSQRQSKGGPVKKTMGKTSGKKHGFERGVRPLVGARVRAHKGPAQNLDAGGNAKKSGGRPETLNEICAAKCKKAQLFPRCSSLHSDGS